MKTITSETFEQEVLQAELPTMVCFSATWCGPCRAMQPTYEEVAKTIEGRANIVKVDVDDSSDIAAKFKIKSIPTMIVFNNGKVVATQIGSAPKETLIKLFGFDQ